MKKRVSLLLILLLLLTALCSCSLTEERISGEGDCLKAHFLDVGQADSTLITCGGDAMLIDGGNRADSSFLYSYLNDEGIDHLKCVVATHPHEDHIGGLLGALTYADADILYSAVSDDDSVNFKNLQSKLKEKNIPLTVPHIGDSFSLGGARVTFLGPVEYTGDANEDSLCLRLDYGEISFLFTGDAGSEAEKRLTANDIGSLEATVLKVGHHGSGGSSCYEFLRAVNPQYAVISCENNSQYGHPHESTLSRLNDAGAAIYRTDKSGTVIFETDGRVITVSTEKGGDSLQNEAAEAHDTKDALYIGNISSGIYHKPTCRSLPKEENRIYFYTLEDTLNSGFKPCGTCKP